MKARRWIERFLLLAGLIAVNIGIWSMVITYASQDWENWVFNRETHGQQVSVREYLTGESGEIIGRALAWWGFPGKPVAATPEVPAIVVRRARPVENNGLVGRLTIPRLHLTAMVREGAGEDTLRLSLGHIPGTPFPGQQGNVGIAGHRDTLFRGLRNVRKNDLIVIETLAGHYVYQVEATEIVKPQDVSVLNASVYPALTLVTCYPFYYVGAAPDRFIVKARQLRLNAAVTQGS